MLDTCIYAVYTYDMTTQIKRWGNSLAVRLPREIMEDSELEEGSFVEVLSKTDEIIIRPAKETKKYTLNQLLKRVTSKNTHQEVDWGQSVGKEVW